MSPRPSAAQHLIVIAVTFLSVSSAPLSAQRDPPAQQRDTSYQVITKGLLGGPVFPVQFRTAQLRLETRNLIMGPGRAERVPVPVRTIMELRGGAVTATVNGKRVEHVSGDFWVLEQGDTLTLENQGDVAVIRSIQIREAQP